MAALIPSASATGSGTMTLAGPSTNSNQTVTIPDSSGSMMVSGNMPAFSAYNNATQTISNVTTTKISLNTEEFDTNNNFDSTTNYRFTPTVAGYYQINFGCGLSGTTVNGLIVGVIYKNGVAYKNIYSSYQSTTGNGGVEVSTIVSMNGSTDYIEFYLYQSTGASQPTNGGSVSGVFANGCMVRSA
jgi:hypothetical protein